MKQVPYLCHTSETDSSFHASFYVTFSCPSLSSAVHHSPCLRPHAAIPRVGYPAHISTRYSNLTKHNLSSSYPTYKHTRTHHPLPRASKQRQWRTNLSMMNSFQSRVLTPAAALPPLPRESCWSGEIY
ncbi:hypothetical protein E2C01_032550 [Portunus trituberculatus]|uniref:Uncharacterized protein n=1 Tax=Portunus trituberculatus TaxID=210409 RepID=A0A5B7EWA3_PORTR|nr:hypothetical protein [Portunus trituberculatus]